MESSAWRNFEVVAGACAWYAFKVGAAASYSQSQEFMEVSPQEAASLIAVYELARKFLGPNGSFTELFSQNQTLKDQHWMLNKICLSNTVSALFSTAVVRGISEFSFPSLIGTYVLYKMGDAVWACGKGIVGLSQIGTDSEGRDPSQSFWA